MIIYKCFYFILFWDLMKIELSLYTRKTPKGFDKQEWHHICLQEFVFWQPKNVGNKTWNTGVFGKKLSQLSKTDGPAMGNSIVIKRAQLILEMGAMTSKTPHPTKGDGFYKFEEDLPCCVREALAIASTGVSTSFFDNPYVRDMLHALNECHMPIYQKSLPGF